MKASKLRLAGICMLLFVLAVLPLAMSTFGQTPTDPNRPIADTTRYDDDRGTNWGWLGLLGLAGLIGLTRKSDAGAVNRREHGVRTT